MRKDRIESPHHAGEHIGQRLVRPHDVEIVVGISENVAITSSSILRCWPVTQTREVNFIGASQSKDDGRHLDGLRASAKD